MAQPFHLIIARIGEHLFDGDALSVTLPGAEGKFEVLAGHEPFVSQLRAGDARIVKPDGEAIAVAVPEHGIAEVSDNQATILL